MPHAAAALLVAMLQSPPMTGYKSGAPTRRAILLALLEREPRTIHGLADAAGIEYANMRHHLGVMTRGGLLRVERRLGRQGSDIWLTDAGRLAAKS